MIHIKPQHRKIIQKILQQAEIDFYAFGSRVSGTHKPLSDLDLCYKEPMSIEMRAKLHNDFIESDLPYTVDLVDYNVADDEFKAIIDKQKVKFEF